MPAAKTSFTFFHFLVLLFVWFGGTRGKDCYLKGQVQSSYSKCQKQCCGSDDNALKCLDTCNGISCTSYEDCGDGCCEWRVYSHDVCRDCPTQPPRTPTTPWNKTRSTTEQPTLIWKTRPTTEEPTPVKLALSDGQIWLVIGFGCAAVVVGVILYYAFRYWKCRRSRRRRAVVVVEREPEINIMMIRQTRTISTAAQPEAATVHSTAANYGFRPEYGHPQAAMPIQYAPPPYQP